MKCQKCNRKMTADEPVYHQFINVWNGYQMICTACETAMAEANAANGLRKFPPWLSPRPCCRCSRPVFRDRPPRKGTRHFCCSNECRQAVQNARHRRKRPRARAELQCGSCSQLFTPSRRDAKFCSAACKQRAHRLARSERASASVL